MRGQERGETRAERAAVGALLLAFIGAVFAVVASATDHSDEAFGIGLAVSLTGVGFALIAWAKSLSLEEVTQARERLSMSDSEIAGLRSEVELTEDTIGRRGAVKWLFAGSLVTLGAAILSPVLGLGPRPKGELTRTSWARGRRLVTSDGSPIPAARARLDQLSTVFPEGFTTSDDSQAVLIRVDEDLISQATIDGGSVNGWICYSKICTHLGCSVGLFGIDNRPPQVLRQLVCPCHQSVFDPLDGAKRIGGPAPRALPQLALAVDDEGYLIAQRDFDEPIGPETWDSR